jgi:hypothetical protein
VRIKYLVWVVVVLSGLLVGCSQDQAEALDVVAQDYGFSGISEEITGGAIDVTFTNNGKADHELVFLDIGDTSVDTFRKEFPKVLQGGPFPSYMRAATSIGAVEAGKSTSATITLPRGDYLLFCALDDAPGAGEKTLEKSHYEYGMRQNVSVEGPEDVELDATGGGTFHAKDYTFEAPDELAAGRNEFAFVNDGPEEWHFMFLSVFPEGTTAKEAEEAYGELLQLEEGEEPPAGLPLPEDVLETGIHSPGHGQTFRATFEAGRTYLAACFIQDREGGPPHAIGHKMYTAFTVED